MRQAWAERFCEQEPDAVRVVRCGELRNFAEPADERLRVADARTDVDEAGEAPPVEPATGVRQRGEAPQTPAPGRFGRYVESHLVDHGWCRVPERL